MELASRGIAVFPCDPKNKKSLVPRGFKAASTDPTQVASWWKRWHDAMIGMPTGKPSGVFALDIDRDEAKGLDGYASLAKLEAAHGQLPETVTQRTPRGGEHRLFKWPGYAVSTSASKLGSGLDVRGDGGYVIVTPSINAKRLRYELVRSGEPAEAPQWLLEQIGSRSTNSINPASDWANLGPVPSYVAVDPNTPGSSTGSQLGIFNSVAAAETLEDIDRVKSALSAIDPDCGYSLWRDICFALCSTNWSCAEDLARTWSMKASKYDPVGFDKLWQSIKPNGGINLGTLFHHAQEAGWTSPDNSPSPLPSSAEPVAPGLPSLTVARLNRRPPREGDTWARILGRSRLASLIDGRARAFVRLGQRLPTAEPVAGNFQVRAIDILLGRETPAIEASWQAMGAQMDRVADTADRVRARVCVVALPLPAQLRRPYPRASFQSRMERICFERGFVFVDPLPALREERRAGIRLYLPRLPYLSEAGHRVVAEQIRRELETPLAHEENGRLPSRIDE